MRLLANETIQILHKALDTASLRQNVLAHNIANVNTPGFKRSYVSFEESLQKALVSGKPAGNVKPKVETDRQTSIRQDGNNVDMDAEMAQLAMNSINYNAATSQLNSRLGMLRYVISEGRR